MARAAPPGLVGRDRSPRRPQRRGRVGSGHPTLTRLLTRGSEGPAARAGRFSGGSRLVRPRWWSLAVAVFGVLPALHAPAVVSLRSPGRARSVRPWPRLPSELIPAPAPPCRRARRPSPAAGADPHAAPPPDRRARAAGRERSLRSPPCQRGSGRPRAGRVRTRPALRSCGPKPRGPGSGVVAMAWRGPRRARAPWPSRPPRSAPEAAEAREGWRAALASTMQRSRSGPRCASRVEGRGPRQPPRRVGRAARGLPRRPERLRRRVADEAERASTSAGGVPSARSPPCRVSSRPCRGSSRAPGVPVAVRLVSDGAHGGHRPALWAARSCSRRRRSTFARLLRGGGPAPRLSRRAPHPGRSPGRSPKRRWTCAATRPFEGRPRPRPRPSRPLRAPAATPAARPAAAPPPRPGLVVLGRPPARGGLAPRSWRRGPWSSRSSPSADRVSVVGGLQLRLGRSD